MSDNMTRSYKDLPIETLQMIVDFLPYGHRDPAILHCALVCKSWKTAFYDRLYSKVFIPSIPALSKFNRTIAESEDIASMVKAVKLPMFMDEEDPEHADHIYTLLTNLPNLQKFFSRDSPCFVLLTDALLNSKLNKLRTVGDTRFIPFTNDYITCILHMKNRLRNVFLSKKGVLYNRLYNQLDQFEAIEELFFKRKSATTIEELDSIVEKCSHLRKLVIQITEDYRKKSGPICMVEERNIPLFYTPRPAVYSLEYIQDDEEDMHHTLLMYIIHKYPNLKQLILSVSNVMMKDLSTFQRLMTYVSKIENVLIDDISINVKWICEGLKSYWEAKRSNPLHPMQALCIEPNLERNDASFSIAREIITIAFPLSGYDLKNIDLFVNCGEHVGKLVVDGFTKRHMIEENPDKGIQLMGNLISSITSCANLSDLTFGSCYIYLSNDRGIGFKNSSLQKLSFSSCRICGHALDALFGGVKHITALSFNNCVYLDVNNKRTPFININLPNTKLGIVSFEPGRSYDYDTEFIFILLSTIANGEWVKVYYRYDFHPDVDDFLQRSNEPEYNNEKYSRSVHLHVCCQSLTSLKVNLDGHIILLPAMEINV